MLSARIQGTSSRALLRRAAHYRSTQSDLPTRVKSEQRLDVMDFINHYQAVVIESFKFSAVALTGVSAAPSP